MFWWQNVSLCISSCWSGRCRKSLKPHKIGTRKRYEAHGLQSYQTVIKSKSQVKISKIVYMVKEAQNNYIESSVSSNSLLQSLKKQKKPFTSETIKQWTPKFCGDIDMRIGRDGTWYYCDSPISRKAMVKLFSSVLIREEDKYFLITPVEKVGITVDDCRLSQLILKLLMKLIHRI